VSRIGLAAIAAGAFAVACDPVSPSAPRPAPSNACPDHPCSDYMQHGSAPSCSAGLCLAAAELGNLVLVVSLASDSYLAPGRTYVLSFSDLRPLLAGNPRCEPGICANLSPDGNVRGVYTVSPQVGDLLNYPLNPKGVATTLPVHVTYRPLWPPGSSSVTADALTAGLPVDSVETETIVNQSSNVPGPALGPSLFFQTYLQPGTYERTVAPLPPFDRVFPPDVNVVSVVAGSPKFETIEMVLDSTLRESSSQGAEYPTFDLERDARLDGWTTFLRDQRTRRPVSNVVPLSGTSAHVVLATNHHPPDGDALTNVELVMAPPPGEHIPTGVFEPQGGVLTRTSNYPPLPADARVQGTVNGVEGSPVEADLVFEVALDDMATGINVGPPDYSLFHTNFEYAGSARATVDTTGKSTYSVELPPGQYRVTVRPLDDVHGITIVPSFQVNPPPSPATQTIAFAGATGIALQQPVNGRAQVTDGRPLAEATVEAIPALCADATTTQSCLPRWKQTTVQDDGLFVFVLDQGTYVLRVRPLEGTGLPWVASPTLTVGPVPVDMGDPVKVPAPVYAGWTLHDAADNAIVNALVRVFQPPSPGSAPSTPALTQWVEIGRAVTDSTGHYDMYLAPAAQ
jgi:hypothetical protein